MGKWGRIFFELVIAAVMFPLLKGTYDLFTAPGTGILVIMDTNGDGIPDVDANTLALIAAIPWALPLFVLIWAIVDIARPGDRSTMQ